jgi:hypothetical protein
MKLWRLININLAEGEYVLNQENQSTKQRILAEALTLFSEKGYGPVTVAEIANAVGVSAPALYKHYKSKQDIFDAIVVEMKAGYERQTATMLMNGVDAKKDLSLFTDISEEKLIGMNISLFLYFVHDDNARKFRKMLTIEQYGNKELAAQYKKQYIDNPLDYHTAIFELLSGTDITISEDSEIMALQYYAPVFLLINLCDCHPEQEPEAIQILKRHVKQFNRIYQNKGGSTS